MSEQNKVLISVDQVKMHFPIQKKSIFHPNEVSVKAVDGISLNIYEGETLGLVGESGCRDVLDVAGRAVGIVALRP